jgi:uncharacterized protein
MTNRPAMAAGLVLTVGLACAVNACALLQPQPDRSQFFLLASQGALAREVGRETNIAVGLGPVKFPEYLDRNRIPTRVSDTRIEYSERDFWAEPLDRNLVRVLSQDIAMQLGTEKVVTFPWIAGLRLTYTVPVEVLRFESDASGTASLEARWSVKDGKRGDVLATMESHFSEPPTGAGRDAAVAALSRTLGRLGEAIAAEIQRLDATRQGGGGA